MIADQTYYYSQAILMFSYMFSKYYIEKEFTDPAKKEPQLKRLLDTGTEKYPCPKMPKGYICSIFYKTIF